MATDPLVLLDELVNRAQTGERLLPWPELTQELAFLAFLIDTERARLAALEDPSREVIEAAAKAMYERVFPGELWENAADRLWGGYRASYTEQARVALAAAASVRLPEGKPT